MPSIFTKIINREIPAHIVWENESYSAMLDINPNNPGHLLLVPKKESPYIFDLDQEEYDMLWRTAKKIAQPLKRVTAAKRIGIVVEGLGIEDHVHVHLIPINEPADMDSTHKVALSDEEMKIMAEKIKVALQN